MPRRMGWLAGAAVVLLAGYGLMLAVRGMKRAQSPVPEERSAALTQPSETHDILELTVEVPAVQQEASGGEAAANQPLASSDPREMRLSAARSGQVGAGCPMNAVSLILDISFASPHGCLVGEVHPGGPAAKAGIKPGDSIVAADGSVVSCPSKLLPRVQQGSKPAQVVLTIKRPKAEATAAQSEGAGETGSDEQSREKTTTQ
jgi:C-terminal processing protease CtpA/Prc